MRLTFKSDDEPLVADTPINDDDSSVQKWELVPLNEIDSSKSEVETLPVRNENQISSTVDQEGEQTNRKGKKLGFLLLRFYFQIKRIYQYNTMVE